MKSILSIITILIGFSSYGQSSHQYVMKNSNKIRIVRNSVYQVNRERFYSIGETGIEKTDSTNISYTKISIPNVFFKRSKSEILPKSMNDLNKLLTILINNPKIELQINGHTDPMGDSKVNLTLSKIRARMIKIYLTERRIKSNRVNTDGFGGEFPICKSPCNENQRVEFVLTDNSPSMLRVLD